MVPVQQQFSHLRHHPQRPPGPESAPGGLIKGTLEADAKISWRVVDNLQLSLAGMNLLHERHVEFINGSLPPLAIPRSVYLSAQLELP